MTKTASRPLLGISCCIREADGEPIHRVIDRYLRAPARFSDADVVLIPAIAELTDHPSLAARLDGLLLTGSTSNMQPARYGGTSGDGPFDPARDDTTLGLARTLIDAGKPVFGICRGFQELNVVFGGTLQKLPPGPVEHHAPPGVSLAEMFAQSHAVELAPGGVIASGLGTTSITVNSVHFQGVDRLGPDLNIEAVAPDGLVEAFSAQVGTAQVLAVQWHPEWDAETNPQSRWFFTELAAALKASAAA